MRALVILGSACLAFLLASLAFSGLVHTLAPANEATHQEILAYLDSPPFMGEPPGILTDAEASHMRDVKRLLDIGALLAVLCLGTIIGIAAVLNGAPRAAWMWRTLRGTGWTLIGTAAYLLAAALLSFDRLFVLFHAVLFPQGNWLFPHDSVLISTYPAAFFQAFAVWWLGSMVATGMLCLLLATFHDRMERHERLFSERRPRRRAPQ